MGVGYWLLAIGYRGWLLVIGKLVIGYLGIGYWFTELVIGYWQDWLMVNWLLDMGLVIGY